MYIVSMNVCIHIYIYNMYVYIYIQNYMLHYMYKLREQQESMSMIKSLSLK